jgi:predicted permease
MSPALRRDLPAAGASAILAVPMGALVHRIIFGTGLFAGSIIVGLALGRLGVLTRARARTLLHLDVTRLSPLVLLLLFWRLPIADLAIWWLPLIGLLVSLSTILPALFYSRWARLTPPQTGSFVTCAIFSNVGYLGAFVLFALYGEEAYGLATLYYLSFTPLFYLLGFSLAKRFGPSVAAPSGQPDRSDQLRLYPFLGMCIGAALNLLQIPRPAILESVNHVLIPLDTALYLIAIGSQLTIEPPRGIGRHGLAMCAIKFLCTPMVAWVLLTVVGVDGLARQVALFESMMPVAISPLMLPLLFGLDQRLSNGLWLFTTLVGVPVMLALLPWLPRL